MNPLHVRDARISLLVLTGVILFALVGLAFDGNWPKVLRVASAFATYASVLMATGSLTGRTTSDVTRFVAAGAAAGFASGVVRPELDWALVVASTMGGIAFALAHRFALTRWRNALPNAVSLPR